DRFNKRKSDRVRRNSYMADSAWTASRASGLSPGTPSPALRSGPGVVAHTDFESFLGSVHERTATEPFHKSEEFTAPLAAKPGASHYAFQRNTWIISNISYRSLPIALPTNRWRDAVVYPNRSD